MDSKNTIPLAVAAFAGLALIAGAIYFGHPGGAAPATNPGTQPTAAAVNIKDIKTDGEPYIGQANAPVTMALFFDYQCPFCKQFEQQVSPQLLTNYVNTGKLKIVFKGFEFLGKDSIAADEFGRAVWELYPSQYYPWLKAMFDAQDAEGDTGFGNQATIVTMTKTQVPGIDTAKVVALVAKNQAKYDAAIAAERTEAQKFGINGTPSVVIGDQLLTQLGPADFYSKIAAYVDSKVKK